MTEHDVVVAGAGHNSLVTAAYLAKAGFSVLVVEAKPVVGGNTATEELTIDGFLHDSCSTAHNVLQSSPMIRDDELHLGDHGLEYLRPDPVVHAPFPDGTSITMWQDIERTVASISSLSPKDGATYRAMMEEYAAVRGVFGAFDHTPIGWGPTLEERLAAHPDGARWMRIKNMSAADVILSRFDHPNVRAFMLWMAFMTMQPPQRPGSGRLAYSLAYGRQSNSWIVPRGGSGSLPEALASVIESHGGEFKTGSPVTGLVIEGGRCVGIETADGEVHRARKAVVSTIHIKHLVEMAPADAWGEDFTFGVETWRAGVSMFVTHYATTAAPTYDGPDGPVTPLASSVAHSVERMLRVGEAFERREVDLEDPPLLVLCPSVVDPSRAPEGHHTLKVVGFQPYELPEGPGRWDEIEEEVSAAHLEHLRRYARGLGDEVFLSKVIKSPLGLERHNMHNWHGSCHGGDQDISQSGSLRPAYGWAQHRMPIAGLYQTGATTHPGGSVSAGPGRNCARVLLDDLGSSLEAVVAG